MMRKASSSRQQTLFRGICALLWIASSVALYFGITEPIVAIDVSLRGSIEDYLNDPLNRLDAFALQETFGEIEALTRMLPETVRTEMSIQGTVKELFYDRSWLAGSIILAFSILLPILKQAVMLLAMIVRRPGLDRFSFALKNIHRWAMIDVFVAATAVIAISRTAYYSAALLHGFVWFIGYFFTSALLMILLHRSPEKDKDASVMPPSPS